MICHISFRKICHIPPTGSSPVGGFFEANVRKTEFSRLSSTNNLGFTRVRRTGRPSVACSSPKADLLLEQLVQEDRELLRRMWAVDAVAMGVRLIAFICRSQSGVGAWVRSHGDVSVWAVTLRRWAHGVDQDSLISTTAGATSRCRQLSGCSSRCSEEGGRSRGAGVDADEFEKSGKD